MKAQEKMASRAGAVAAEASSTLAHFPVPSSPANIARARRRVLDAIREAEAALVNLGVACGRLHLLVRVGECSLKVGGIPAWRKAQMPYLGAATVAMQGAADSAPIDVPADLWKQWVAQAREVVA